MKDWKEILEEKINEYSKLSPEELEGRTDEAISDIYDSVLPAFLIQNPNLDSLLDMLTEPKEEVLLSKPELMERIDEALDEKDEVKFRYYSRQLKNHA